MPPMPTLEEAISRTRAAHAGFEASYRGARRALETWIADGTLSRDRIEGRRVLDWECGLGAFSACFLELGAREVVGIDSWLDVDLSEKYLSGLPNAVFRRLPIEACADDEDPSSTGRGFDLVFANTVSEHLAELPARLRDCRRVLLPDGELFLNHDNYFQPVGSHDHGFLFYDESAVVFQGVDCWARPEKCAASEAFLADMQARIPWSWDAVLDGMKDPESCEECPYFRRAQPWAHLIYHEDFRRLYPHIAFSTGYEGSTLNKMTTFQLRQSLIECGFDVELWQPDVLHNRPPQLLLDPPFNFNELELRTSTVAVRCRKSADDPYGRPGERRSDLPAAPSPDPHAMGAAEETARELAERALNGRTLLRLAARKLLGKLRGSGGRSPS